MIYALKHDRITQLLTLACIFVLSLIIVGGGFVVYDLSRQRGAAMGQAEIIANLNGQGFVIGKPESGTDGITRLPCLTPQGQLCGIKVGADGRIVEMGLSLRVGEEVDSIPAIVAMARLVAPEWDAAQWAGGAIEAKRGETVQNGYKFQIAIFGLGIFAAKRE